MCWFGGFPGVWQYSTASALSKEDVILSCYSKNWVKAVSLLWAVLAELHLRRGSETKTTTVWDREMLGGGKWTPSNLSGTALIHISLCCKRPNGVRSAAWRQLSPRQHWRIRAGIIHYHKSLTSEDLLAHMEAYKAGESSSDCFLRWWF